MSFTPINTQEEFDDAIKERLAREKKKYEGYIAKYEELATEKDVEIEEKIYKNSKEVLQIY